MLIMSRIRQQSYAITTQEILLPRLQPQKGSISTLKRLKYELLEAIEVFAC